MRLQPFFSSQEVTGVRLEFDLRPTPCHAGSARLTQAITNLLTNAIHVTPADLTITLRTR